MRRSDEVFRSQEKKEAPGNVGTIGVVEGMENVATQRIENNLPISYKKVIKQAAPMSLLFTYVNAIDYVNGFVCAYFLKKIDLQTFAAGALINIEFSGISFLFMYPLVAVGTIITQDVNALKSPIDIGRTTQAGWIISVVPLSVFAIGVFSASKPLLIALRQNHSIAELVQSFFWAYLPGVPAHFIYFNSTQLLMGCNKRVLAVVTDAIALGLSLGTTYIFALGKLGLPRLGTRGYGYAQLISNWLNCLMLLSIIFLYKKFRKFKLYLPHWQYMDKFKQIAKTGVPIMVAGLGEVIVYMAQPLYAGSKGRIELAAQGIISSYAVLVNVPSIACLRNTVFFVSRAIGKNKPQDVKRYIFVNLGIAVITPLVYLILAASIPNKMADLFISNISLDQSNANLTMPTNTTQMNITLVQEEIYSLIHKAFPVSALATLFDAMRMVLVGAVVGLQDAVQPSLVNLCVQLFITLPLMYALCLQTHLNITGLHVANVICLSMVACYLAIRLNIHKFSQTHVSSQAAQKDVDPKELPLQEITDSTPNANAKTTSQQSSAELEITESVPPKASEGTNTIKQGSLWGRWRQWLCPNSSANDMTTRPSHDTDSEVNFEDKKCTI